MDRHKLIQKLKSASTKQKAAWGGGVSVLALTCILLPKAFHHAPVEPAASTAPKEVGPIVSKNTQAPATPMVATATVAAVPAQPTPPKGFSALVATYADAFSSARDKLYEIRHAEEQNERLQYENTHLRLKLESLQFDCHAKDAADMTKDWGIKLTQETGSRVGRTLASISYKPPTQLLPPQLYTLGVSYFKGGENEKAAVILSFLTGMEDSDAYKTSRNYLLTAVSWYRVDNLDMAGFYLDQALKLPESGDNLPAQAQARLWKALVAQRLQKHDQAQYWLRELVDHHPHSSEAGWVNYREGERAPAYQPDQD